MFEIAINFPNCLKLTSFSPSGPTTLTSLTMSSFSMIFPKPALLLIITKLSTEFCPPASCSSCLTLSAAERCFLILYSQEREYNAQQFGVVGIQGRQELYERLSLVLTFKSSIRLAMQFTLMLLNLIFQIIHIKVI